MFLLLKRNKSKKSHDVCIHIVLFYFLCSVERNWYFQGITYKSDSNWSQEQLISDQLSIP